MTAAECEALRQQRQQVAAQVATARNSVNVYDLTIAELNLRISAAILQGAPPGIIFDLQGALALATAARGAVVAGLSFLEWQLSTIDQQLQSGGCNG